MQIIPDIMSKQLTGITKYLPAGKEKLATKLFTFWHLWEDTHNTQWRNPHKMCQVQDYVFLREKKNCRGRVKRAVNFPTVRHEWKVDFCISRRKEVRSYFSAGNNGRECLQSCPGYWCGGTGKTDAKVIAKK